jgi:hypothetical protein
MLREEDLRPSSEMGALRHPMEHKPLTTDDGPLTLLRKFSVTFAKIPCGKE